MESWDDRLKQGPNGKAKTGAETRVHAELNRHHHEQISVSKLTSGESVVFQL